MIPKADLKIDEQKAPPVNNWCRSGHSAPKLFRRTGVKSPEEPTRFYKITSAVDPNINGVYCEVCLILSNALVRGDIKINKDGNHG